MWVDFVMYNNKKPKIVNINKSEMHWWALISHHHTHISSKLMEFHANLLWKKGSLGNATFKSSHSTKEKQNSLLKASYFL